MVNGFCIQPFTISLFTSSSEVRINGEAVSQRNALGFDGRFFAGEYDSPKAAMDSIKEKVDAIIAG